MPHRRSFLFMLAACVGLTCGVRRANACSCATQGTVLNEYEWAEVVVVARVASVEKTEKAAPKGHMSDGTNYVDGVKSTTMVVEKSYKGDVKAGEEMTFAQGGGADCIWTFSADDIGRKYLFYLKRLKNSPVWIAGTCGRSRALAYATDDLLYLNKLDKVRGKTRLSGTVEFGWGEEGTPSPAGITLHVTGPKTYELKTDAHGVYQIYDLPAGKYVVQPEVPHGWKLDAYGVRRKAGANQFGVVVEDRKHAAGDIRFVIDNGISGKVYDALGRPMDNVCLDLMPASGEAPEYFYKADCTENGGKFSIDEIPPGSYVLVVNKGGKISSSEPFGTFYYPNASRREEGMVFHVGPGDFVDNVEILVPKMEETITVEGVFLFSDGKPVVDEFVEFKSEKASEGVDADARANTDAKGRFSIKILKGQKGRLYGGMHTYAGEFENCPKLDRIIKQSGSSVPEVTTPAVGIQAENNIAGLELRFAFPSCKKAKID